MSMALGFYVTSRYKYKARKPRSKTPKITRIMTELWPKHIHTPELGLEYNKRPISAVEWQLLWNHGGPPPPQDHHKREGLRWGASPEHMTQNHNNYDNFPVSTPQHCRHHEHSNYQNMYICRQHSMQHGQIKPTIPTTPFQSEQTIRKKAPKSPKWKLQSTAMWPTKPAYSITMVNSTTYVTNTRNKVIRETSWVLVAIHDTRIQLKEHFQA